MPQGMEAGVFGFERPLLSFIPASRLLQRNHHQVLGGRMS
jgi:hypothetical protein